MAKGFIKLERALFNTLEWPVNRPFTAIEARIYLRLLADRNGVVNSTQSELARRFNWNKSRMSKWIKKIAQIDSIDVSGLRKVNFKSVEPEMLNDFEGVSISNGNHEESHLETDSLYIRSLQERTRTPLPPTVTSPSATLWGDCIFFRMSPEEHQKARDWYTSKSLDPDIIPDVIQLIDDWLQTETSAARSARKTASHYRRLYKAGFIEEAYKLRRVSGSDQRTRKRSWSEIAKLPSENSQ